MNNFGKFLLFSSILLLVIGDALCCFGKPKTKGDDAVVKPKAKSKSPSPEAIQISAPSAFPHQVPYDQPIYGVPVNDGYGYNSPPPGIRRAAKELFKASPDFYPGGRKRRNIINSVGKN